MAQIPHFVRAPELAGGCAPNFLGQRIGLAPQGLPEGLRRRRSIKALAQDSEPSDLDHRHSSRSSHKHLSQRLRSSTLITLKL
jgi:hypothetical protein